MGREKERRSDVARPLQTIKGSDDKGVSDKGVRVIILGGCAEERKSAWNFYRPLILCRIRHISSLS